MKQVYKKIIVSILAAAFLFAPVAPGLQKSSSGLKLPPLSTNIARAQSDNHCNDPSQNPDGTVLCLYATKITDTAASFKITITNTKDGYLGPYNQLGNVAYWNLFNKEYAFLGKDNKIASKPSDVQLLQSGTFEFNPNTPTKQDFNFTTSTSKPLEGDKTYFIVLYLEKGTISTRYNPTLQDTEIITTTTFVVANQNTFTTPPKGSNKSGTENSAASTTENYTKTDYGIGVCLTWNFDLNPTNCVAGFLQVIWEGSALIARLGATFLDFFVYYSTNSGSYDNVFVSNGWGAVRDIANIFFIIILLYIAIKTVLGLGASNSKKLVAMVIVVALVINFSLFATRIVIDSTNILAKIFYNSITPVNEKGGDAAPQGIEGQKQISVGIVSTFNPQSLLSNSFKYAGNENVFIFIQILLIAITLYLTYIFFAVALLFVGRVIALWMAMIFSPFAFASFALPFDIPKLGHKEWWKNLLENALLAPLFIFFLYLVVMFSGFLKDIISYKNIDSLSGTEGLFQRVMSVAIPFIIIAGLLREAKNIAVKYSGEFGEMLHRAGSAVGGMVVGGTIAAATGGAALAMRSTLGKMGSAAENSATLKAREAQGGFRGFLAARTRDLGRFASGSTFDARNIKVAGKSLPSGGPSFLRAREGGNEAAVERKVRRRQERAERLKVSETEPLKQELNKAEAELQDILGKFTHQLEMLDKKIQSTRQDKLDWESRARIDPNAMSTFVDPNTGRTVTNKEAAKLAAKRLQELKDHKTAIMRGREATVTRLTDDNVQAGQTVTINYSATNPNGTPNTNSALTASGHNISEMQDFIIPEKHSDIAHAEHERLTGLADKLRRYGGRANMEAQHKIRMHVKLDDKGGHH